MGSDTSKIEAWWAEETTVHVPSSIVESTKKSYDERLVAWIDILGMRNRIKSDSTEAYEIFQIMEKLRNFVEVPCAPLAKAGKMHYLQIADGFMLVADKECASAFCEIISEVQWRVLTECGMLLRGAITLGKVSVSDDPQIIIGPAYVEAYELESANVIYPRVILTNRFQEETKEHMSFSHIAVDVDKEKYVDFLSHAFQRNNMQTKQIEHLFETQGVFKSIKENLSSKNKSVHQKWGWLTSQLDLHKISVR